MNWWPWFQIISSYFLIEIASSFKGEDVSLIQSVLYFLICTLLLKIDAMKKLEKKL